MKAVILAGGKGTRLAPYTKIIPKPLVPLGGRPILDIIIRQLAHYDFRDIILSVGYFADLIEDHFKNSDIRLPDVNLSYVKEDKPMGTAGSLSLIPELTEAFMTMNGDVLTTMDYSKLSAYHREKGGILTIAVCRKLSKIDLGVIEMNNKGVLTGYMEKPENTHMVSMGVYVYEPKVLEYIDPGAYLDFPDLVIRLLNKGEKVMGYTYDGYWLDIGRHEDYIRAQEEFIRIKDELLPKGNCYIK